MKKNRAFFNFSTFIVNFIIIYDASVIIFLQQLSEIVVIDFTKVVGYKIKQIFVKLIAYLKSFPWANIIPVFLYLLFHLNVGVSLMSRQNTYVKYDIDILSNTLEYWYINSDMEINIL